MNSFVLKLNLFIITLSFGTSIFANSFEPLCKFQQGWTFNTNVNMREVFKELQVFEKTDRLPNGCDYKLYYNFAEPRILINDQDSELGMAVDSMIEIMGVEGAELTSCLTGGPMKKYWRSVNGLVRDLILHFSLDGNKVEIIEGAYGFKSASGRTSTRESILCLNN